MRHTQAHVRVALPKAWLAAVCVSTCGRVRVRARACACERDCACLWACACMHACVRVCVRDGGEGVVLHLLGKSARALLTPVRDEARSLEVSRRRTALLLAEALAGGSALADLHLSQQWASLGHCCRLSYPIAVNLWHSCKYMRPSIMTCRPGMRAQTPQICEG